MIEMEELIGELYRWWARYESAMDRVRATERWAGILLGMVLLEAAAIVALLWRLL